MLAANLSGLFAAKPLARDGINLEQIFPYLVGIVLALGIILVGLVMCRSGSKSTRLAADRSVEEQLDRIYTGPSQLWKLVFPASAILLLGGVGLYFVLPAVKGLSDWKTSIVEQAKANQEAIKKKARHDSFVYYPRGTPPAPKPTPPPPQPLVPGFAPPPPPHVPSTYIDSRGVLRVR